MSTETTTTTQRVLAAVRSGNRSFDAIRRAARSREDSTRRILDEFERRGVIRRVPFVDTITGEGWDEWEAVE